MPRSTRVPTGASPYRPRMAHRRRVTSVTGLLALPLAVLLLCHGRYSHADASKRAALKQEIEALLTGIASELRDVPSDSGTSDLERTVDHAGRVAEKARDLKYVAEEDADARRIGDYYPDIAGRYRDAARYLREMKVDQRKLDDQPRRCEDATRDLTARLRAYTDTHDPRGLDEVPKVARELGKIGKACRSCRATSRPPTSGYSAGSAS